MRKYHRWISVIFGVFLLWISATGLLSHGAALYRDAVAPPRGAAAAASLIPAAQAHEKPVAAAVATPAAFICPETMTCRAKPDPDSAAAWVSFFHHIHAGEEFGPIGTAISILSGFALFFFAFSGLWMYLKMYRNRRERGGNGMFWQ